MQMHELKRKVLSPKSRQRKPPWTDTDAGAKAAGAEVSHGSAHSPDSNLDGKASKASTVVSAMMQGPHQLAGKIGRLAAQLQTLQSSLNDQVEVWMARQRTLVASAVHVDRILDDLLATRQGRAAAS